MAEELLSTSQVAKLLGISRIAVFKKVKSGKIKARKIGRNFVIEKNEMSKILGSALSERQKQEIDTAVEKAVREYGEALKLLGNE